MKPQEIEQLSFSIIDKEAGKHDFNKEQWKIVQRVIHTSADFEYIESIRFHQNAISSGITAVKNGCTVITDTNMAKSGIKKKEIEAFGGSVKCFIGDEDVARYAKEHGITRAAAAVDKAAGIIEIDDNILKNSIYAAGNAPTALLRLIELIEQDKRFRPALVIGLPVGFVNAFESKEELIKLDIPYISNKSRKGGSNVAASVVNALIMMALS